MKNNPLKVAWWRLAKISRNTTAFYKEARQASKITGTGVARQSIEIIALRIGRGKLTRQEYYDYSLFNKRAFSWNDKKQFFGKAMENKLVGILGMNRWGIVAHDKCLFNTIFEHMGFPVAAIYGTYQEHKVCTNASLCSNRDELVEFLRESVKYPFISKPIYGIYSRNVTAIESFKSATNEFVLTNGKCLDFNTYVDSICHHGKGHLFGNQGYMFQELLRPHADIVRVCGNRICSIRLVILISDSGPEIFRALWKISAGDNMADNYWRPENMLAVVDAKSGSIQEAVQGRGKSRKSIHTHPDTGVAFKDVRLPDWSKTVELCLGASEVLPNLPMQAWDIALTDRGPILLEVNLVGGLDLPQIAMNSGVYDETLSRFLDTYGFT